MSADLLDLPRGFHRECIDLPERVRHQHAIDAARLRAMCAKQLNDYCDGLRRSGALAARPERMTEAEARLAYALRQLRCSLEMVRDTPENLDVDRAIVLMDEALHSIEEPR